MRETIYAALMEYIRLRNKDGDYVGWEFPDNAAFDFDGRLNCHEMARMIEEALKNV